MEKEQSAGDNVNDSYTNCAETNLQVCLNSINLIQDVVY